jgi:hypothetical protein
MTEEKLDAEQMLGHLLEKVAELTKQNTMLEIRLNSALARIPQEEVSEDSSDPVQSDELDK